MYIYLIWQVFKSLKLGLENLLLLLLLENILLFWFIFVYREKKKNLLN